MKFLLPFLLFCSCDSLLPKEESCVDNLDTGFTDASFYEEEDEYHISFRSSYSGYRVFSCLSYEDPKVDYEEYIPSYLEKVFAIDEGYVTPVESQWEEGLYGFYFIMNLPSNEALYQIDSTSYPGDLEYGIEISGL